MVHKFELIDKAYINSINADNFDDIALSLFRYQYEGNIIYRQFADALHRNPDRVKNVAEIPFLPIHFFKTHKVVTGTYREPALLFESSGTTGEVTSKHFVYDQDIYKDSLLRGFRQFYGDPAEYVLLGLLPSYLERSNASLVHMAKTLIEEGGHKESGFYLNEWEELYRLMIKLEQNGQKVLLLGVTFALLDFAQAYPMQLKNTIVMETGGMKGRREEWTRTQVHDFLKTQWQLEGVHSEYGMTELLSQAYALSGGEFRATDTMKVLVRDINDPLEVRATGSGCINVVDLANVHSCAFIATEDIGNLQEDGSFEVMGRVDHSALRGCSLMAI